MPDYRKPLSQLRDEWIDCTKCELGQKRIASGGAFVAGEGSHRGIMFIGEGPGSAEEQEGRPFVGPSGLVLRGAINSLKLTNYYITNVVACRSCAQAHDGEGNPVFRFDRKLRVQVPLIRDEPPSPKQVAACLPRLHEEIYLVDPILIVALGAEAAKALLGRPVSITTEHGQTQHISIPGAWHVPVLTAKRQQWGHKVRGQYVMPTKRNEVRYLMMPIFHPAYVLRFKDDRRHGNPVDEFVKDMRQAAQIYDRYLLEVYGKPMHETREYTVQDLLNTQE